MAIFYTDYSRKEQPCWAEDCERKCSKGTNIVRLAEVGERYCRAFHPECAERTIMKEIIRMKNNLTWDPNFKRVLDKYRAERRMRVNVD